MCDCENCESTYKSNEIDLFYKAKEKEINELREKYKDIFESFIIKDTLSENEKVQYDEFSRTLEEMKDKFHHEYMLRRKASIYLFNECAKYLAKHGSLEGFSIQ